ncbi:MAG: serine/threonine-protein kinase, partial [Cyanophyceae cyanobacterium]
MASETRTDPWLGRQIGHRDRYRLDRNVGGGGMGDVYLATDLMLGKQVALKLLKEGLVDHADLRQRFDREITISAALGSEHIVQVTDHGITSEGNPFFVMEYLKGESLGSLLKQQKRIPFARAMRIILQVCTGLQVAHRGVQMMRRDGSSPGDLTKVIHRDLKPDNIFLTPHEIWGEWVKILDFGIAKIRSDQLTEINKTLSGSFLGTMRYAAPEQWQGKDDIDVRADLYSLGVLFYEMVSGTDPFGLQSHSRPVDPTSWLMAHITTQAQSLRLQNDCSHIPAEVDEIFLRCLAKDPADRFADAGELQVALKNCVSESLLQGGLYTLDETAVDHHLDTTPGPQVELFPEDSLPPITDQPSGATSGIVGLT